MTNNSDVKFDLDDIVLIPAEESKINSRTQCKTRNTFQGVNVLPIMASPMDTVVSVDNHKKYIENGILPCIPRETHTSDFPWIANAYFQSFGLSEIEHDIEEFEKVLNQERDLTVGFFTYSDVLIDIANGHMSKLIPLIKKIKKYWPKMNLMVGNVANPETFINLAMAGADYVRCSVGTGCFLPGQIIKLNNNEKNIEDVIIGDEVLTHLNEYKKIINKFEYYINDEIYEINNIKCTQNHEFYVIEKEYENLVNDENIIQYAKWISAKELDINKHLLVEY